MFGGQIYIEAKIYELQRSTPARPLRHFRGMPEAEQPRRNTGVVHEVFRRITNG